MENSNIPPNQQGEALPQPEIKKDRTVIAVVTAVILTALIVGAGVYAWQYSANKKTNSTPLLESPSPSTSPSVTPLEQTDLDSNLQTYIHPRYNYKFQYPTGAAIIVSQKGEITDTRPASRSGEKAVVRENVPYLDGLCVSVKYLYGSVTISSPDNYGYELCGPTGVGIGAQPQSKTLTIDNQQVEASGFFYPEDETSPRSEFLAFTTPHGFYVAYGLAPSKGDDLSKYDEVKRVIEQIASSVSRIK